MIKIDWNQLERNSESKEVGFESFNFQIAWKKYSKYGSFEYDYNTPGSEFYLTLHKDCEQLNAEKGDIIGWQAKFWLNHKDYNNTTIDSNHRDELVKGFTTSLSYKKDIKTWVICTPGQPTNTKPHKPKDKLLEELRKVRSELNIMFWNKPFYEAFYNENPTELSSIFAHYFSTIFIGYDFLKNYSSYRINLLKEKFDTDLYTPGEVDQYIYYAINLKQLLKKTSNSCKRLKDVLEKVRANSGLEPLEFKSYKPEYIKNSKSLLDTLITISAKIIDKINIVKYISICEDLFLTISKEVHLINELVDKINKPAEIREENKGQYSTKDSIKETEYHDYLNSSIDSILYQIKEIYGSLGEILKRNINVFGKAGYGKTNLACSIYDKMTKENIPALLILASELKSNSQTIKRQILDSLSIDSSMNFLDLLGALNNLGFLKNTKIPIIIDGLNETTPTADIWSHELNYLIQDIKKHENLVLITTSRESYVDQVFQKSNYKDVENNYYLDGFDDNNIDLVIDRYLAKYNIRIINKNYDKQLLKNPLLLKIFSITNKGKTIVFSESNIYQSIENYISELIEKVSIQNKRRNPVLENVIKNSINQFSIKIWEGNSRRIEYLTEFTKIFDPDYDVRIPWENTNTYKVLDEGIFISREIVGQKEFVEFTYYLLGGFCIAEAVVFNDSNHEEIINKIKSKEILNKLTNTKNTEQNHPLSEDIIKAIIYLFPKYTKQQVFEVFDNDMFTKYSISMINQITSTDEGKNSFSRFISKLDLSSPNMSYFLETILSNVINRDDYGNVSILVNTLLRMDTIQIDLNWSEHARKYSTDLMEYLNQIIELCESVEYESQENLLNKLFFIALLLSSTNRLLRDTATKALVTIGIKHTNDLFLVFKRLEKIADLYVIDRLFASLCGVIIQVDNKDLTLDIVGFLEKQYLKKLKTSHILILDYVNTIMDFASYKYNYTKDQSYFDTIKLSKWHQDENCKKEMTGDGKATWGYGPVRMDFAKYVIGSIASRRYLSDKKTTPTLKECLAMVIWRMKELGYSEVIYGELDKEVTKHNTYNRFDNTMNIERYGKKYSWIAFFELLGYFVINKLISPVYDKGFRVSRVDIDPTFPKKPPKMQLVTECFLPEHNENIQDWINKDKDTYLEKVYTVNLDTNNEEWILLNCSLEQEGINNTRINIYVDALLVKNKFIKQLLTFSKSNYLTYDAPHYYYLFGGEIPWSKNFYCDNDYIEIGNEEIEVLFPYSWYSWESYHSEMNDIDSVAFVSKSIALYLELKYDLRNLFYYTNDGKLATKYIWDDYSHYLYIRKDLMSKFIMKHDLSLIWYERGSRYGDFGEMDTKLNPSYKDFKSGKSEL